MMLRSRVAWSWAALAALALVVLSSAAYGGDGGAVATPTVGPEFAVSSLRYGSTSLLSSPSGSCGPDRCLAVWNTLDYGSAIVIDGDGKPIPLASLILDGNVGRQSAAFIGSDFVAASFSGTKLTLLRVSPDGLAGATQTVNASATIYDLAVAWNGSRLLVAFRDGTTTSDTLRVLPFDSTLKSIGTPITLATESNPFAPLAVVVSGTDFVVLAAGRGWKVAQDGQPSLGPVTLPPELTYGMVAVSAAGVPIVLGTSNPLKLFRLGADLQPTASITPYLYDSSSPTLGWNGTHLLLLQSGIGAFGSTAYARRYNPDLTVVDTTLINVPTANTTLPLVFGRGSEFMFLAWKGEGYSPASYGIYSQPLNSGGRARSTTESLISVAALQQRFPIVAAQPSGFVAVAREGVFGVGVMPLGVNGRPTAGRPAAAVVTERYPVPSAVGISPTGGMTIVGGFSDTRTAVVRFDGNGALIDTVPLVLGRSILTPSSLVWNGTSYLWVSVDGVTVAGTDGSFGALLGIYYPASPWLIAADAIGSTTLTVWVDGYQPAGQSGLSVRAIRLEQAGTAIDAAPYDVGESFPHQGTGLSLAHDGTRYLAAWDTSVVESNGALTSDVRVVRIGADGRAADSSSTLLRRATGAVPGNGATAVSPLSTPTVVFDGSLYWVVWREQGVWLKRVGTDGTPVDPNPIKLLDEPFEDFHLASRGDGTALLVYSRLDRSPDVQSLRLKARRIGVGISVGLDGGSGDAGSTDGGRGRLGSDAAVSGTGGRGPVGTVDGAGTGAGGSISGSGGGGVGAAPNRDGSVSGVARGGAPGGDSSSGADSSGSSSDCGCRIGGARGSAAGTVAWLAMMLVALARARRTRPRAPAAARAHARGARQSL